MWVEGRGSRGVWVEGQGFWCETLGFKSSTLDFEAYSLASSLPPPRRFHISLTPLLPCIRTSRDFSFCPDSHFVRGWEGTCHARGRRPSRCYTRTRADTARAHAHTHTPSLLSPAPPLHPISTIFYLPCLSGLRFNFCTPPYLHHFTLSPPSFICPAFLGCDSISVSQEQCSCCAISLRQLEE